MEVLQMNYIRTARAKGLDENAVFYRHALRNAFIPVVTLSSIILTWLITGTIFVENVFAYPGLGQYVVTALLGQDYPGILAATIVFAVTIAVGNLVADLLYAVVDPQIRIVCTVAGLRLSDIVGVILSAMAVGTRRPWDK